MSRRTNLQKTFPLEEGGKGDWWILNKREKVNHKGDQEKFQQHNPTLNSLYNEHLCNILNFGPNTYRHVPIDYDDYIDVLFLYIGSKTPCIWTWWFVLYIGRKPIINDMYMFVCVGSGPWSTWLMRCFVLSGKLWSTWVIGDFCWARRSGAHEWLIICV